MILKEVGIAALIASWTFSSCKWNTGDWYWHNKTPFYWYVV